MNFLTYSLNQAVNYDFFFFFKDISVQDLYKSYGFCFTSHSLFLFLSVQKKKSIMSARASRHQRRPSQSVFINFDDLSSPISDNAMVGNPSSPPSNRAQQSSQIRAPPSLPPPAIEPQNVLKNDQKVTDVKI